MNGELSNGWHGDEQPQSGHSLIERGPERVSRREDGPGEIGTLHGEHRPDLHDGDQCDLHDGGTGGTRGDAHDDQRAGDGLGDQPPQPARPTLTMTALLADLHNQRMAIWQQIAASDQWQELQRLDGAIGVLGMLTKESLGNDG
jgi:hypothetical protein